LCLVVVAAMVWAAFWQLRRLHQHDAFAADVTRRTQQPIANFDAVVNTGSPGDLEWRTVRATGTYVTGKDFEVVNLGQNGQSGHDAVNGLRLADGSVLVVNRGFVAGDTPLPPAPTGQVTVVGRVRRTQTASTGQQADDGTQHLTQIRRVDLGALTPQFVPSVANTVQPVFLDALQSTPHEPSVLVPVAFPDLNGGPPHLSYIIQWIIFSICVIVGWVFAVRKSIATRAGTAKKKRPKIPPIADEFR
ncbi:MAG: SURF1 family protein, partial [Actinomycetota bacterium]